MTKWRDLANNLPILLIFNRYLSFSKFSTIVKYIEIILLKIDTRSILVAAASYKKGCLIEERRQGAVKAFAREEGEVGGFKCQMSYVMETSSYLWKIFFSEKTGCRWRGVMK